MIKCMDGAFVDGHLHKHTHTHTHCGSLRGQGAVPAGHLQFRSWAIDRPVSKSEGHTECVDLF